MPSTQSAGSDKASFAVTHVLKDVQEFIQFWRSRNAIFGWNDFTASDVIDPVNLGDGIIVFPPNWSTSQCNTWRLANHLAIPVEFSRTPPEFERTNALDFD